ncbi:MAG: CHAD domain-containing protein [bacterium]
MKYTIKRSESIPDNIRRIILAQQKNAIGFLARSGIDTDLAIHETRKCFKRIRAVYRMIRYEIGKDIFQQENICFSDAGRMLSGVRDSVVLIETLSNIKQEFQGAVSNEIYEGLKSRFENMHRDIFERIVHEEKRIDKVATALRAARFRVAELPIQRNDFGVLSKGIRKIYSKGYKTFIATQYNSSPEMFHEWRKMVKNLWYLIAIFKPINPPVLRKLSLLLDRLSDLLGLDHDLHRLDESLRKLPEVVENIQLYETLFNCLMIKSFNIRAEAWKLGSKIYIDNSKEFVAKLEGYWDVWKKDCNIQV